MRPLLLLLGGRSALALLGSAPPLVLNTWAGDFTAAAEAGFARLAAGASALDAAQAACAACERRRCGRTVGGGGSPDEACETTLDALVMDGTAMRSGAVAALRRVRDAVAVARRVLDHTQHSLLAGDQATDFALANGFALENLTSSESAAQCAAWRAAGCQPNFRRAVRPDASSHCGPYVPIRPPPSAALALDRFPAVHPPHDTVSVLAMDASGAMAAATSTNGAAHKIPGRVGDGPIVGSGAYVDSDVGGCGATGDGDIMLRFLPCYQAVESMRRGMSPADAAADAIRRMLVRFPSLQAGLVVANNKGEHAGAACGWTFSYSYRAGTMSKAKTVTVEPLALYGPGFGDL